MRDTRNVAQIVIRESLHRLVHRFDDAQFVAEHEQLNGEVENRLPAEGWYLGNDCLAGGAVAGETGGELLFERGGADR